MINRNYVALLQIMGIHILLVVGWVILSDKFLNLRDFDNSLESGFDQSPVFYTFFALLIAPLWEEFLFRLPFRNSKYVWVSIVLGFVFVLGLKEFFLQMLILLYVVMIIITHFKEFPIVRVLIIVLSCLAFGLIHLNNYEKSAIEMMNSIEIFAAFICQFVLGCVLTYVRLNHSFRDSIIYHSVFNGVFIALGFSFTKIL